MHTEARVHTGATWKHTDLCDSTWHLTFSHSDCMQIWSHNPPIQPQKQAVAQPQQQAQAATVAVQGAQQVQGAQALMPGVRPGLQQGVRPVGPGSAVPLHTGMQGAPQYMQANPAVAGAPMYQPQRYPVAPGTTPQQQAQMQYQYSQYVQQQGGRPPATEAQIAEQRRQQEELMERNRVDAERRAKEAEVKRQKVVEEQRRRTEEKERQRKQAEDQRMQQKREKELEKQRRAAEKENKRLEKIKQKEDEKERKRQEREQEKQRRAAEKANSKGPKRKPAPRSGSGKGPSSDGAAIIPLPDGVPVQSGKKRPPSRPNGGTHPLCSAPDLLYLGLVCRAVVHAAQC